MEQKAAHSGKLAWVLCGCSHLNKGPTMKTYLILTTSLQTILKLRWKNIKNCWFLIIRLMVHLNCKDEQLALFLHVQYTNPRSLHIQWDWISVQAGAGHLTWNRVVIGSWLLMVRVEALPSSCYALINVSSAACCLT